MRRSLAPWRTSAVADVEAIFGEMCKEGELETRNAPLKWKMMAAFEFQVSPPSLPPLHPWGEIVRRRFSSETSVPMWQFSIAGTCRFGLTWGWTRPFGGCRFYELVNMRIEEIEIVV